MTYTLTTAMIFAAGRGERMRPLTDTRPKPLLEVAGKPLIVWQIERLARAGFTKVVINHAWLGEQIEQALGEPHTVTGAIAEREALETAGGIAQALPLLETDGAPCVFAAISGDVFCEFDYARLREPAVRVAAAAQPSMHLVMVPNPPFHPRGDFALDAKGQLSLDGSARYTFGNIGVYDTRMFHALAPGERRPLTPYYREAIAAGLASGELYEGRWENVGTPDQLRSLERALGGAGGQSG